MLEAAEAGHSLSKEAFERAEAPLRTALVERQYALQEAGRGPVIVVLAGLAGVGRSAVLHLLTTWMDPRFIRAVAFGERTDEERAHPPAWRYWQALPPRGRIGIFMNAWYDDAIAVCADAARYDRALQRIREHEDMLAAEGCRFVKLWLHMRGDDLERRLAALGEAKAAPKRELRQLREQARDYARRRAPYERLLRETSSACAPWAVVESTDPQYRDATAATLVLEALRDEVRSRAKVASVAAPVAASVIDNGKRLRELDLGKRLDEEAYEARLGALQHRLALLTTRKRFARRSLVVVFEGVDAAGKGGAIRRVTAALDARRYVVVPVSAPSDEERAHAYLWRFWRHAPRRGGIAIFDRSWYGRVLVERVEGFASEAEWRRAYDEINRFEEELAYAGAIVVKLWLQVSRNEQLRRFRERGDSPFKRFKLTKDDWRNRRAWSRYERAAADMIDRTGTIDAPWTLVEAEDKRYARVRVLEAIVERLDAALERDD
jgi:polyphosphate:AMP phosphotransferase